MLKWLAFALTVMTSWACGQDSRKVPLGINLSGVVDWSTEFPFVDVFRTARSWVPQEEGKPWGQGQPLELTPEGWVKSLRPRQYATTMMFVHGGHQPGVYICVYDGEGALDFQGNGKVIKAAQGRMEVEITKQPNLLIHLRKTDPTNPLRNIRFLMPGHEKTYLEKPFNPSFVERTKQFSVIRFMDWMNTNNSKIASWNDRPLPTDAIQSRKGVCLELMVALCNQLQVSPWFCMPHLADDDYVTRFAEQVKASLDPRLKIHVEYSNEVWNGQFEQARYAQLKGKESKLSNNAFQAQLYFHSKRSVEIFNIWERVFGGRERLVRVLGSQSANPWVSEQVMDFQQAYKHADAVAIAPYFGGPLGDPKAANRNAERSLDEIVAECSKHIEQNQKTIRQVVQKARERGLQVLAYEGGQHLVGHGGAENNEKLTKLLIAANRDPRMKELYLKDLQSWETAGGGLFVVFSSVGQPSKWGSWGILEAENQDVNTAPKYQGIMEYLRK
ncbi:MAG: hypothetical protein U0796_20330 [Gemmatales bacterium]